MDPTKTNAARRLHAILTVAISDQCQNQPTKAVIRKLFQLDTDSDLVIYRSFSKLLQLIGTAQDAIGVIPAH